MAKRKRRACSDATVRRGVTVAKAAISEVFDGLYSVNYLRCKAGRPMYEGRLRHPDGQKVWATVTGDRAKVQWRSPIAPGDYYGLVDKTVEVDYERAKKRFG